ncbi:MAG TPA: ABC transporter permease [Longimicrobiales bacterium]|nr:ABC transporter permease [Longimicrobiales bacterium]
MRIESLHEGAVLALDQLRANKTRSALTILGIIVGVATVMAMSAVVAGVRSSILSGIEAAGPKNFMVARWDFNAVRIVDDGGPPWGHNPPVSLAEVDRISQLPLIKAAIPGVNANGEFEHAGERISNVQVAGRGAEWSAFQTGTILAGHNFLPSDVSAGHAVAVISRQLAEDLFGAVDPVGRGVRVNGQSFTVVGVFEASDNIFASMVKHVAIVPYTAAIKYLRASTETMTVFTVTAPGSSQDAAMDQVISTLRTMRGLRAGEPNDFALIRQEEMVRTFNKITGIFFIVMIALSSVGLMVGGVGVVAIMMIAVTERTREIGIRKALGATQREILWQFLIEAVTVTLIGATLGMALGGAGAFLVDALTPIPAKVPFMAVVAALAMAAVAGVLFGLWPAWRAARMDPVVALRYE